MNINTFWGRIANNIMWLWVGFITGVVMFGSYNFWLVFLGEILGIFVIWVVCTTLDALFGNKS